MIYLTIQLRRTTSRTIKVNIAAAVGIKFIILTLALIGRSNLALAIFADVGVTVIVVINGLRLFTIVPTQYKV